METKGCLRQLLRLNGDQMTHVHGDIEKEEKPMAKSKTKQNHDYTKYANQNLSEEVVESVVTEEPVVEEPVVPEVEVVEEETVTPEPPAEPVYGVVTECVKLNVRKEPDVSADVLTTILLGTEVLVDEANSTEDFYKIVTGAGVEGFCVKKFININS